MSIFPPTPGWYIPETVHVFLVQILLSARIGVDTHTDRQTDKQSTVTLAAQAHRGLIINICTKVEGNMQSHSCRLCIIMPLFPNA